MELVNRDEHLNCHNYDQTERPVIEVVRIVKDTEHELCSDCSEIVFFMEGRLRYVFEDYPEQERVKGQILFLPAGGRCTYKASCNTMVMIFRLRENIRLCESYSLENLYKDRKIDPENFYKPQNTFAALEINPRLWHFLDGINDCLADGLKCKTYFEIKIREFFIMLRVYYPKEQIREFFYLVLSPDMAFTEYIRLHAHKYKTMQDLAASMKMTPRVFAGKFSRVFNESPYKWMNQSRAQSILHDLITTDIPLKQLAENYHFSGVSSFSSFCSKNLGDNPTNIREKNKPR